MALLPPSFISPLVNRYQVSRIAAFGDLQCYCPNGNSPIGLLGSFYPLPLSRYTVVRFIFLDKTTNHETPFLSLLLQISISSLPDTSFSRLAILLDGLHSDPMLFCLYAFASTMNNLSFSTPIPRSYQISACGNTTHTLRHDILAHWGIRLLIAAYWRVLIPLFKYEIFSSYFN